MTKIRAKIDGIILDNKPDLVSQANVLMRDMAFISTQNYTAEEVLVLEQVVDYLAQSVGLLRQGVESMKKQIGSKIKCKDCGAEYWTNEGHQCEPEIKQRDSWLPDPDDQMNTRED